MRPQINSQGPRDGSVHDLLLLTSLCQSLGYSCRQPVGAGFGKQKGLGLGPEMQGGIDLEESRARQFQVEKYHRRRPHQGL